MANDSKSTDPARRPAAAPSLSEQKEKWFSFEAGLLSILKKAAFKTSKQEQSDIPLDDQSLFDPKNWDPQRVQPLVDRVWPHLTLRERRTASEWLWYTIGKLENMRQTQRQQKATASASKSKRPGFLVPKSKTERRWLMPQMKVVMTQKASETSEARAATPQGEGTTIDAIRYGVDWVQPEAGSFPKFLGPMSP